MHPFRHLFTINRHRHLVRKYCFKCHLYRQGLTHDLSKYSFTEFWRGAKYFQGFCSPNAKERKDKGYSEAWMHHKGRNKHHAEYWIDINLNTHQYEPVPMPINYLVESFCDRIAASKVYKKKEFKNSDPLEYFNKESDKLPIHPDSKDKLYELLSYYSIHGEKDTFKYVRKVLKEEKSRK